jgi:nanoRNase/pAp phosphatase (c-di-AMP/oligoRNAs hydrolase)
MIQRLRIPLKRFTRVDPSKYYGIGLADAQPGTGNNLLDHRQEAPLIVVDHHPLRKLTRKARFHDIRPTYGSTSTIITEYLHVAGLTPTRSLANALLYGIKTDTNSLLRGSSPADFHAFIHLSPMINPRVVGGIERPALPIEYFHDYHRGLSRARICRDVVVADLGKIDSEAIIPELADVLLRIDGVCWSLCMGYVKETMIVSIRSTSRTFGAGNVIRRLFHRRGPAGGHKGMAGGQVTLDGMADEEIHHLAEDLIRKFLLLIDRQGVHTKPLVNADHVGDIPI